MFWLVVALAASGFLIGLRFRAPAALFASLVAAVAGAGAGFGESGWLSDALLAAAASVCALQLGYLSGLAISSGRSGDRNG